MTPSSAQRSLHTLVRLGYLRRDARLHGWMLTPRTLDVGYPYLAGHPVIEQATPHLIDLNQACGESVSLSEPDGMDMVFIARFPSRKPFFIHMPVGRRSADVLHRGRSRLPIGTAAGGSERNRAALDAAPLHADHAARSAGHSGQDRRGARSRDMRGRIRSTTAAI